MYKERILDILAMNGIAESVFHEKVYRTLLMGVFEVICKEIRKQNTKILEKEHFRKSKDKIAATKRIVMRYVRCELGDDDYIDLSNLLTAFFRTGDPRKGFDKSFRGQLVARQNGKCAICNTNITVTDSHLDHVIPWDYVGDELDDNYQMLCPTCNERKGASTHFELSMLLLNKKAT